jgi:hypothetical protein
MKISTDSGCEYICSEAVGSIMVGNAAITSEMKARGYYATIAATVGDLQFQDLHVTYDQLIDLQGRIEMVLRHFPVNHEQ